MNGTAVVIESQLDWLSVTGHTDAARAGLLEIAGTLAALEAQRGNDLAPFATQGFRGHICGRASWGKRSDGVLLRLSGNLAAQEFDRVNPIADRVTRLDLAVTVRFPEDRDDLGAEAWRDFSAFYAAHPISAKPERRQSGLRGETVYLGSRRSPTHFRLYNKHQESIDAGDAASADRYDHCWRYELECKGLVATSIAHSVDSAPDRPAFSQDRLYHYLTDHGGHPAFPETGDYVPLAGFRRRSDTDSRLSWFRDKVRASVDNALTQADPIEVYAALGLAQVSTEQLEAAFQMRHAQWRERVDAMAARKAKREQTHADRHHSAE